MTSEQQKSDITTKQSESETHQKIMYREVMNLSAIARTRNVDSIQNSEAESETESEEVLTENLEVFDAEAAGTEPEPEPEPEPETDKPDIEPPSAPILEPQPVSADELEEILHQMKVPVQPVQPESASTFKIADNKVKIVLILKIQNYQKSSRFGDYVRNVVGIKHTSAQLHNLSIQQLESILVNIRTYLDQRSLDQMFDQMAQSGIVAIEKMIDPVYECKGFSHNLLNNESFLDTYERMKLESKLPSVPTPVNLAFIMMSTLMVTHEINKVKKNSGADPYQQSKEMEPPYEAADLADEFLPTSEFKGKK